jgi:hypothetical protein
MNRKRVILAALLGILTLCLLYAYLATPRLTKAPPKTTVSKVRPDKSTKDQGPKNPPERINFDYLTMKPKEFSGAQRDIFRFVQIRQVQAEVPIVSPPPPVITPVMPVQPAMPIETVRKTLGQFTFLGFLEKSGEKKVFLSSGGNLYLVTRGESFGTNKEFLVSDIKDNLLKVRHAGRDDIVEVQLVEQQKLNASVSAPARISRSTGGSGQSQTMNLAPKRRQLRPAVSQESEQPVTESNEETNPAEEQVYEPPATGDVLEGEVNGSNQ